MKQFSLFLNSYFVTQTTSGYYSYSFEQLISINKQIINDYLTKKM